MTRYLSLSRIWNALLVYSSAFLSFRLRRPILRGMPLAVSVEPVNRCNLRCPECALGARQLSREPGQMDPALLEQLVDENRTRLLWMNLFLQGEPFLHPDLTRMIAYASRARIHTTVSTNGHFLDGQTARDIVHSGLDRLIVSIDGADQESYAVYRRGGDLERVIRGVREVIRARREMNKVLPRVIIQFLITRKNEQQLPAVRQLVRKLGADRLEIKSMQLGIGADPGEWIPSIPRYSRYELADGRAKTRNPLKDRCLRLWTTAVVSWDGNLLPCCFDKDGEYAVGQVGDRSLAGVWKGKEFLAFRQRILKDRKSLSMCRNCSEGMRTVFPG